MTTPINEDCFWRPTVAPTYLLEVLRYLYFIYIFVCTSPPLAVCLIRGKSLPCWGRCWTNVKRMRYSRPIRKALLLLQTSRGKVCGAKLGSCDYGAAAFGESTSAQFIRLPRKTTALKQAKGETPIKKYSNTTPSNLGLFSCKATKKHLRRFIRACTSKYA